MLLTHYQNTHECGDHWDGEDLSVFSKDDTELPVEAGDASARGPSQRKESMTTSRTSDDHESEGLLDQYNQSTAGDGLRAAPAYVRPYPMAIHGKLVSYGFDLKSCTFDLASTSSSKAHDDAPTEIFLPSYHFPENDLTVEVSGGRWSMEKETKANIAIPMLKWWPNEGEQKLRVKGSTKRQGLSMNGEEDSGWLERCRESVCALM